MPNLLSLVGFLAGHGGRAYLRPVSSPFIRGRSLRWARRRRSRRTEWAGRCRPRGMPAPPPARRSSHTRRLANVRCCPAPHPVANAPLTCDAPAHCQT
eukprot:scaffold42112_cov62-Phaeocystis_antarctica.AAC.3